tara:strand:- start:3655 stop:4194 length:540 start_codon:yes stop_codon:yes gene_type:complete
MAAILFRKISERAAEVFTHELITSLITKKGNTQTPERQYIAKIKQILGEEGLTFSEAGSQQSKDFRNIGGIGLNIEVKKTDSFKIMCNDACPTEDINYIIIFTGKTTRKENYPPQLIFKNGQEITEESPWINDYLKAVNVLKDTYCRGDAARDLPGPLSVYIRPNISVDIRKWLVSDEL